MAGWPPAAGVAQTASGKPDHLPAETLVGTLVPVLQNQFALASRIGAVHGLVYGPVADDFLRPFQVAIGLGKGMKKDTRRNPKTITRFGYTCFLPGLVILSGYQKKIRVPKYLQGLSSAQTGAQGF
jgi:hypothetical protein